MFEATSIHDADFDKIILKDVTANTSVEIIPGCGAILHAFTIVHNDALLNVIDSYENTADFKNNVTAKGFKSCKLSPFVCRIKNATYNFGDKTYAIQKFLLNSSALHGLLYDAPFIVSAIFADEKSASVTLQYTYTATDKGYPFKYTCAVTYVLKKENVLTITTTITNDDEGLIPIQDGWHPYFSLGSSIDELQLEFQSKDLVVFDEALVPTGELVHYEEFGALKKIGLTEFDNCFTLNFAECQPMCVLRNADKKIQIEIYPEKSYPYLQVYTPSHRNSIAIENLSAAPDAFNNGMGLKVLEPAETATFITAYKITLLP
jgi:aldose 1-epimerase